MAAPVYQSTQVTTWATAGSTVVITKPTGLAVGDLMICRITTDGVLSISNFSGFTSFGSQAADSYETFLGWKVADSSDVAASNFTITLSNPGSNKMGSITRITGAEGSATVMKYTGNATNNSISPSFAGVTPTNHGESVIILQFWNADNASGGLPSISAYAIATSNPSWTEEYEITSAVNNDVSASMAYAVRPEVTATGNFSCNTGTGTADPTGQLLVISAPWNTTISESTTLTETTKGDISSLIQESVTLTEDFDTEKPQNWINLDKSSTTWDNLEK